MALTTNFGITLLNGSDTAGYSSINTVIQSVDTALAKINVIGMIMIFDTSLGSVPTNYTNITNTVAGLPTLSGTYVYIKKTS